MYVRLSLGEYARALYAWAPVHIGVWPFSPWSVCVAQRAHTQSMWKKRLGQYLCECMHSAACTEPHIWQPQGLFLSCNEDSFLSAVRSGCWQWEHRGRVHVCMFTADLRGCCLCTWHHHFVVSQVRCAGSLCLPVNETHCVDYSIQAALWKTDEG